MVGDGPEGQPTEGVATLTDLVGLMDNEEGGDTPDESAEGDEPEESEGEEVDEPEEAEGEEEGEEEATIVLKHEGKEIPLKQSEVVELAQKGFDYSQKTMALAEERKGLETVRGQTEQLYRQQEHAVSEQVARLQALEQFFAEQLGAPPPAEWAQQDVGFYVAKKEEYEARKGQLEQARSAIGSLQHEQARQRQAWIVQQADATETALKSTLPGWNENTLDELAAYAGKYGLTPQTVDVGFVQKGFWEMAHKAKQYDALLEKKATMKPVSQLSRVATPQAKNQPSQLARRQQKDKAYAAKPSLNTLADLL
jgi:hypothetical protein